jgi:hypothetical protein
MAAADDLETQRKGVVVVNSRNDINRRNVKFISSREMVTALGGEL